MILATAMLLYAVSVDALTPKGSEQLHGRLNFQNLTVHNSFPNGASSGGPLVAPTVLRSDGDDLNVTFVIDVGSIGPFNVTLGSIEGFNLTNQNPLLLKPSTLCVKNETDCVTDEFGSTNLIPAFNTRLINGAFPGPVLSLRPGQRLVMNIVNALGPNNPYTICCTEEGLEQSKTKCLPLGQTPDGPLGFIDQAQVRRHFISLSWKRETDRHRHRERQRDRVGERQRG